jgi:hypothetical protein
MFEVVKPHSVGLCCIAADAARRQIYIRDSILVNGKRTKAVARIGLLITVLKKEEKRENWS